MTDISQPRPRNWVAIVTWSAGGLVALILTPPFVATWPDLARRAGGHPLHPVDWALFASQALVLQIHVVSVSLAAILGGVMMASKKGRRFHRVAGWAWTLLVTVGALSAVGMGIASHRWNWIQLTVPFVFILLVPGVVAARLHNIPRHRSRMMWLYYSSILGAGALTFTPGRLMWRLIFG